MLWKISKTIISLLFVLFLISGCSAICTGGWNKVDTVLELTSQGLMSADWIQTQKIVKNPDKYQELNPVLGPHPSMSKLNTYFALWVPVHAGVSCILPQLYRRIWQGGTIGVEAPVVYENNRLYRSGGR